MQQAERFPNLLVVIGASAGGLSPIRSIVSQLPSTFQGVVVVATHRDPAAKENSLLDILGRDARLTVREPVDGESLQCTTIYVGHPSQTFQLDGRGAQLDDIAGHMERSQRIDELFHSAARHAGSNAVGIILSGTLDDGIAGLKAIHEAGGTCIVQDPQKAKFEGMPREALATVDVDLVGDATEIASLLVELAAGRSCN